MNSQKSIIISDPASFEKKKLQFKNAGVSKLHVVTDFDRTLTPCFSEGKKVNTIIAQLRNHDLLGEEYSKKAFALYARYHPIEIDAEIPLAEKARYMREWWTKHELLMVEYGLSRDTLSRCVSIQEKHVRAGFDELLSFLSSKKVPVLIISSSLGDVIKGVLTKRNLFSPTIHILSNFFDFDSYGKARKYCGSIVHTFNKSESEITDPVYVELIRNRTNVLLLGDSISDLDMASNLRHNHRITIGFLNEPTAYSLGEYQRSFDVVILNDGSLEFVNNLLKELFE